MIHSSVQMKILLKLHESQQEIGKTQLRQTRVENLNRDIDETVKIGPYVKRCKEPGHMNH